MRLRPPVPLLRVRGLVGLVGVLAMLACSSGEQSAPASQPNLILLSIDTLRADHVGAYGYSRPTTPAIEASMTPAQTWWAIR